VFVPYSAAEVKESLRFVYKLGILSGTAMIFIMLLWLELGGQTYIKYNMLKTYNVARQIEERTVPYEKTTTKLCIVGNMESGNYPEGYPKLSDSQHWLSASHKIIWQDYNGCQNCWQAFMKQYLGKTYEMCTREQYDHIAATPEYLAMGIFPEENSVMLINDIIVIKLSDSTGIW
ncbi:MAG: hypothetical protein NC123_20480, partial [Butyrivibrio sp.]|nr:hypothetical protein [Butyrivibrio sp.]